MNKDDWFVCLHIRTSFYHKDTDSAYTRSRNSTPKKYEKMIKYIYSIGGKVIRLGDPVDMAINSICIDYPNSKYKSELMDLFLIKNCKFYIGTNSGILDSAFLFGTPVLGVNFSDFCLAKGFKSYDKILYKHVYHKKNGLNLALRDIFNQPIYVNPNINPKYRDRFEKNYFLKENSEDELLEAIKEMTRLIFNNKKELPNLEYNTMIHNAIARWIEDKDLYAENKYRYYIRSFCNGQCFNFQLNEKL